MMTKKIIPKRAWIFLLVALLMLMFIERSDAQTFPTNFQRVTVASGLVSPSAIEFLPDGRVLVCQKGGQLRVIKNGSLLTTPALTLSVNTSGERGLIGVAADPSFAANRFVYLYYSTSGTTKNRVSRFTMNGDLLSGEQILLDFPNDTHMYHNGGGITFGADGKLYILSGDDKNGANAQNLDNPFGKVLRINPDGSIPSGNPFTGGTTRSKVWAYGVRNPYTLASDPLSSKLYVNDVGESTWEEVNDATLGGRNFGWPDTEGSGSNLIYRYATNRVDNPPNGQGCAISGGTFFNGAISNYPSTYNGKYFFLDYCGGWIDYINPSVTSPTRTLFASGLPSGMLYIKQNPNDGNLYYININNGSVYKVVYNSPVPVITQHPQNRIVPVGGTATFTVSATGTAPLSYQWKKNGVNITGATSATYTITNVQLSHAGTYTVTVSNSGGSVTSNPATLTVTTPPVAAISSPSNGAVFRAGDVISYSGSGTDNEDGSLPATAFTWWVDFHHATHTHPGPELADGTANGSFAISTEGHSETNVWYRIYLKVTDSHGASDTAFVEIFPKVSNFTLQTVPAGLQVKLDATPVATPLTTQAISGHTRPVEAFTQTVGGTTYVFDHWAHGGPAAQTITITDNDVTYTAHYRVAPTPVVLSPAHDAYVRDGTNAGITYGTTDPTLLITKLAPAGQVNNNREAYLMFNTSSVTGTVSSVILRVYGKVDLTTVASVPVGVFPVSNTAWTESALTWNNKPAAGTTALTTANVTNTAFAYYDFNVTSYVQAEKSAGRHTVAFALKSQVAHDPRVLWNSKEFGSNSPQLSIIAEGGNASPIVSVTSPTSGATFTEPANITITANASDSDGTVAKVEFFNGATKLGEDLTSPYSFTWSNVVAGFYTLTARATDNANASTTSSPVNITVQAPPSCPAVVASADDGNVAANVLDNNFATRWSASGDGQWIQFCLGTEQNVRGVDIAFYSGNVRSSIFDVLLSTDGSTWNTAATGLRSSGTSLAFETFTFTPRVSKYVRIVGHGNTVNLWNSYTEVRVLTGAPNAAPTVSITSPLNNASFTAPATIIINANAADSDGTISKVEFFQGATKLGEDLTSPYNFTWSNVAAGSYTLTARATDNASATTTSSAVNITVTTGPPCDAVTASSHDGNVPANVLDNDLNTRWSASGDGQWIQFCLGSVSTVSGVQIAFYKGNERSSRFDVLVSTDGTSFTSASAGRTSSGTSLALETFSFTAVSAKYVRIVGHGNNLNLWNSYTEVRITSSAMLKTDDMTSARSRTSETNSASSDEEEVLASYPNPADGIAVITYRIKESGWVTLSVNNAISNQKFVLVNQQLPMGTYQTNFDTKLLPSGVHLIKLVSNGKPSTFKLLKK
jgi:glucose/arabinose dehydrogenase